MEARNSVTEVTLLYLLLQRLFPTQGGLNNVRAQFVLTRQRCQLQRALQHHAENGGVSHLGVVFLSQPFGARVDKPPRDYCGK